MTREELVHKIIAKTGLDKKDASLAMETILAGIVETLQSGDKIEIRGFGCFKIRERGPRIGRNPKTGESVKVPAKRIVYFKPGRDLMGLVNK